MKKLCPLIISGFCVMNAHKIKEKSSSVFALKLFRAENQNGFIKALSDKPD